MARDPYGSKTDRMDPLSPRFGNDSTPFPWASGPSQETLDRLAQTTSWLSNRDCLLLQAHLRQEESQAQIGARFGIHQPTVCLLVKRIRRDLVFLGQVQALVPRHERSREWVVRQAPRKYREVTDAYLSLGSSTWAAKEVGFPQSTAHEFFRVHARKHPVFRARMWTNSKCKPPLPPGEAFPHPPSFVRSTEWARSKRKKAR